MGSESASLVHQARTKFPTDQLFQGLITRAAGLEGKPSNISHRDIPNKPEQTELYIRLSCEVSSQVTINEVPNVKAADTLLKNIKVPVKLTLRFEPGVSAKEISSLKKRYNNVTFSDSNVQKLQIPKNAFEAPPAVSRATKTSS
ncbi:MAG: hypothetical protein ACHP9Y_02435 [Gammaproteobacteria bacterium]